MSVFRDTLAVCHMIKIEHSVFALPFALTGAFLAQKPGPDWSAPSWRVLVPLVIAMVAVRSFAMGYNRLADLDIDRLNLRTQGRPLVTGELSVAFTKRFLFVCAIIFTAACAAMNSTCLLLSPVALAWSAFYSHTKRFTPLCHFALGSVLGLAPLAGWLAVSPTHLGYPAVLLFFAVTLWVAGFDILYACQDADFDRSQGLFSLPAHQGVPPELAGEIAAQMERLGLPEDASFDDLVWAVRQQQGKLGELDAAVLFLDEWRKLYAKKNGS